MYELQKKYGDDIEFVRLNIDDETTLAAQREYGFRSQPLFILLDADGEIIMRWQGYNSPNVFEEAFTQLLSD